MCFLCQIKTDDHASEFASEGAGPATESYSIEYGKWGASGAMGTSGGTVTWSLAGAGVTAAYGLFSGSSVALASFLSFDYQAVLESAFETWSSVADIDFLQVADGGGSIGTGYNADIRITGGYMDGNSGTLAAAYLPGGSSGTASQGPWAGDINFDSGESGFWTAHSFYLVAVHEIGHSLGLSHESTNLAVMNPYYNSSLTGLTADDIAGIQAIYGAREPATVEYTLSDGMVSFVATETHKRHTITGNDLDNVIRGGNASDTIRGGSGDDRIYGTNGGDMLFGDAGDDILNGGAGGDTMRGGAGDDRYFVDASDDVVVEGAGAGIDSVHATRSYRIGSNVENLYLLGGANLNGTGNRHANELDGNAGRNTLRGGAGNDRLSGNGGNDVLDGGSGIDVLTGGTGNDIYRVDHSRDVVVERSGQGVDTVVSTVSKALSVHVENLLLLGGADLNGVGNGLANKLVGNGGDNRLTGHGGDDALSGRNGHDTLLGGFGNDRIDGGAGNDVQWGQRGNDKLLGGSGDDIQSGGGGNDMLYGQQGNDRMVGNGGDDRLLGGTGNDRLNGGGGIDVLHGQDGADVLSGGEGADRLDGGSGNDRLVGGGGNDRLVGQTGNDVLIGGGGADDYVFAGGFGVDRIIGFDADSGAEDIDLRYVVTIKDFADLLANHMTQVGRNVVIDALNGDRIILQNVDISDLDQSDFHI